MSPSNRIPILDRPAIERKLKRMAFQIWELNSEVETITVVGVESGGAALAVELADRLREVSPMKVSVLTVKVNKRRPAEAPAVLSGEPGRGALVLVDDVANSGRTLLYALQPLMAAAPASITLAVLVDRQHKSFPVAPDIVGHTLATTLQEHIVVEIADNKAVSAYIE